MGIRTLCDLRGVVFNAFRILICRLSNVKELKMDFKVKPSQFFSVIAGRTLHMSIQLSIMSVCLRVCVRVDVPVHLHVRMNQAPERQKPNLATGGHQHFNAISGLRTDSGEAVRRVAQSFVTFRANRTLSAKLSVGPILFRPGRAGWSVTEKSAENFRSIILAD